MKLTDYEVYTLSLLSRALRGKKGAITDLPQEVERIASRHGVLPLLYDAVSPPEDSLVARAAVQCVKQSYHLLVATKRYTSLLKEGGCDVVVLKGASVAALYPVPEYRKSGDLDLLLRNRHEFERADALLRKVGAVANSYQHANHHIAYELPDGFELELHLSLVEDFDDRDLNRKLASIQKTMRVTSCPVLGVELPVLEKGAQALSLLLHMLQHFLLSGFGLKLLCDWVCFWRAGVPRAEREWYRSCVSRLCLTGFSEIVTDVCCRYLGLSRKAVTDLLPEDGEERVGLCEDFMREVFDGEEFGKSSDDRMVMLRGSGVADYAREFHHQMHLNFPNAGRCPLLWPGLWAFTLARFMRNNHRYRDTSLLRVLRSAGKRSKLYKQMRLFEKE